VDRKWWTLLASCIAIFMLLLDVTIVNVALPSIERDLGADFFPAAMFVCPERSGSRGRASSRSGSSRRV
jgi:MFS family permease